MPSMSPRTQQMQVQQGAGPNQQTALFEKGLSQMAYNVLLNKLPDLVENVVTFKNPRHGHRRGHRRRRLHHQAARSGALHPSGDGRQQHQAAGADYHKALNIFLPLSKGWLDELDKISVGELGHGVKTPDTLSLTSISATSSFRR